MTAPVDTQTFKYEVGEEVVVRLESVRLVEVTGADLVAAALPSWTIAEITVREVGAVQAQYTISFVLADDRYGCIVPESAIDGTA
jgi:hypothetical protein